MALLKAKFHIISLKTFLQYRNDKNELPSKTVVITFDDGWEDNYLYAFPIIRKYEIPATIFLTTEFIGTHRLFWPERVSGMLNHLLKNVGVENNIPEFFQVILRQKSSLTQEAPPDFSKIIEKMKILEAPERERLVAELERRDLKIETPDRLANRLMNWEQISEMNRAGIEFGAHGATHRILTHLSIAEIREEVRISKKNIEEKLGIKIDTFAYPNGNYNEKIIEILQEDGFQLAVTTKTGLNTNDTDLFQLRRKCVDDKTLSGFRGRYSEEVFSAYLYGLL
jgi:peptidoglycan/xylan/chitin deacetylase (PgdA/CDA1 family)